MVFDADTISSIIQKHYGIKGRASKLPGELDLNYFVEANDGLYIFKIANIKEEENNLLLQHAVINHLTSQKFGLATSAIVKTIGGEEIIKLPDEKGNDRFARLLTWIKARVFAKVNPHSPRLLQRLGEMFDGLLRLPGHQ